MSKPFVNRDHVAKGPQAKGYVCVSISWIAAHSGAGMWMWLETWLVAQEAELLELIAKITQGVKMAPIAR